MKKLDISKPTFTNVLEATAELLKLDFRSMSSQIKHSGTKGSIREDILIEFLKKHMPKRFGFAKGEILSSKGEVSRQIDIIVYDQQNHPVFYHVGNNVIVPSESVMAVIEVKSKLNKKELENAAENIKTVKKMDKSAVIDSFEVIPTRGYIFAYDSSLKLSTIAEYLEDLNETVSDEQKINFICILNRGLIFYYDQEKNKMALVPHQSATIGIPQDEKFALPWFFNILYEFLTNSLSPPTKISNYLHIPLEKFKYIKKESS